MGIKGNHQQLSLTNPLDLKLPSITWEEKIRTVSSFSFSTPLKLLEPGSCFGTPVSKAKQESKNLPELLKVLSSRMSFAADWAMSETLNII